MRGVQHLMDRLRHIRIGARLRIGRGQLGSIERHGRRGLRVGTVLVSVTVSPCGTISTRISSRGVIFSATNQTKPPSAPKWAAATRPATAVGSMLALPRHSSSAVRCG